MATFISNGEPITQPSPQYDIPIVSNNGAIKVSPNLFDKNSTLANNRIWAPNFSRQDLNGYYGTNIIKVIGGHTYTRSGSHGGANYFKLSDNTYTQTSDSNATITVPDNAVEWVFNNTTNTDRDTMMVVEGSSLPAEYMPYGQIYTDGTQEVVTDSLGNTANAQMLLAVGSYQDTQEVLSGAVSRSVGVKVFDGTETWNTLSNDRGYYTMVSEVSGLTYNQDLSGYCTHFQYQYWSPQTSDTHINTNCYTYNGSVTTNGNITFRPDLTVYDTVDKFKTFLASQYANGTPVIVVYPLATATTESVTSQLLQKSPVTQTAGSIDNLPIAITESQKTVPTPQQPLQINCNNGVLKVSPNIINTSLTREVGYDYWAAHKNEMYFTNCNSYNSVVGSYISLSGFWNASAYGFNIPCVAGDVLRTKGYTGDPARIDRRYYVFVNNDGLILSKGSWDDDTIIVAPANTAAILIEWSLDNTNISGWLITKNNPLPTNYIPYGQIYTDGTTETVEVTGKNLFDYSAVTETGKYINDSGDIGNDPFSAYWSNIPVKPSTTYTCSGIANFQGNIRLHGYAINGTWDRMISKVAAAGASNTTFTFTTNANEYFIGISGYYNSFENCQVEQGSTATTYEPYFNGGSALAENLLKVGTYQDIQSVLDGEVTRNVGVKVLNGTEDYVKESSRYYFTLSNMLNEGPVRSTNLLCSHFLNSTTGIEGDCFKYSIQIYFYPNMTLYPDTTAFKQWLTDQYAAGTPVIVVYPLATATTESVTAQPLTIQADTNIVEITQASMDNLELEVSYKATV